MFLKLLTNLPSPARKSFLSYLPLPPEFRITGAGSHLYDFCSKVLPPFSQTLSFFFLVWRLFAYDEVRGPKGPFGRFRRRSLPLPEPFANSHPLNDRFSLWLAELYTQLGPQFFCEFALFMGCPPPRSASFPPKGDCVAHDTS